jgi:YD repeat-containing protein
MDGSRIDYTVYYNRDDGRPTYAFVEYPKGLVVAFYVSVQRDKNTLYPDRILDQNGNQIEISYRDNLRPDITTISDTLQRTITFNYDTAGRLVSISGPRLYGGEITTVNLHYGQRRILESVRKCAQ